LLFAITGVAMWLTKRRLRRTAARQPTAPELAE
jgi:hypothetical protein